MTVVPKTPVEAAELFRRHDPLDLYGRLAPWQQQELLCIVRRVCREIEERCKSSPSIP